MTTDTPATDRTPLDLDAIPDLAAIRDRAKRSLDEIDALCSGKRQWTMRIPAEPERDSDLLLAMSAADARNLCDVVDALRAELDAARAEADAFDELADQTIADANKALAQRDAARAYVALHLSPECQHTNAHDGCDETVVCKGRCWCTCHDEDAARAKPTTDDGSDVGAAFDPREPLMPRAVRAERTEPATGEDVEVVARILHNTARPSGTDWYATANDMDRGLAQVKARGILAALDLPGRERALREALADSRQERDVFAERLKAAETIRRKWRDQAVSIAGERDAANAALTDVARLLDEARVQRDAARADEAHVRFQVAQEIALHLSTYPVPGTNGEWGQAARRWLRRAADIARQHATGEGGAS